MVQAGEAGAASEEALRRCSVASASPCPCQSHKIPPITQKYLQNLAETF